MKVDDWAYVIYDDTHDNYVGIAKDKEDLGAVLMDEVLCIMDDNYTPDEIDETLFAVTKALETMGDPATWDDAKLIDTPYNYCYAVNAVPVINVKDNL